MTDATELNNGGVDSKARIAVLIAAKCVSMTSLLLMPLIIGALVADAGFTEAQAGLILSAQFAAIAISSLAIATRVDRWNRRLLCAVGIGLVLVGNGLSMIADSFTFFLVVRFITGLGEGTGFATVSGTAAGARDPQRLFALIGLTTGFYSAAILLSGGFLIENFGTTGIFGLAGLIALVLFPAAIWFPAHAPAAAVSEDPAEKSAVIGMLGILGLFGYAVFAFGHSTIWAYVNSIGGSIGLSIAFIGTVLAVGAAVAPVGSGLAHVVGTRFGITTPTAISLFSIAGCMLVLGQAQGTIPFVAAIIAKAILLLFLLPYVMGALSVLDPSGRLAAASPAFFTVGIAFGPGTGGMIISQGFAVLAWASFGIILVGGALICLVSRLADSRSAAEVREVIVPAGNPAKTRRGSMDITNMKRGDFNV